MGELTLNQIRDFILWIVAFGTATNATKNYLVQQIGEIDRNGYLDGATRVRFYEQLQHYEKDLHGNSYIHDEIERLKKENKL